MYPTQTTQLTLIDDDMQELIVVSKKQERFRNRIRKLRDELEQLYKATPSERPRINAPGAAAELVSAEMSSLDQEELWVMLLDTRNAIKGIVRVYRGSLNSSQVRIGEVYKPAIVASAASIIVFHNHPSGDPSPSPDDVVVTRAIIEGGKLLDIQLLDHIVIGNGAHVSMKERGLAFS